MDAEGETKQDVSGDVEAPETATDEPKEEPGSDSSSESSSEDSASENEDDDAETQSADKKEGGSEETNDYALENEKSEDSGPIANEDVQEAGHSADHSKDIDDGEELAEAAGGEEEEPSTEVGEEGDEEEPSAAAGEEKVEPSAEGKDDPSVEYGEDEEEEEEEEEYSAQAEEEKEEEEEEESSAEAEEEEKEPYAKAEEEEEESSAKAEEEEEESSAKVGEEDGAPSVDEEDERQPSAEAEEENDESFAKVGNDDEESSAYADQQASEMYQQDAYDYEGSIDERYGPTGRIVSPSEEDAYAEDTKEETVPSPAAPELIRPTVQPYVSPITKKLVPKKPKKGTLSTTMDQFMQSGFSYQLGIAKYAPDRVIVVIGETSDFGQGKLRRIKELSNGAIRAAAHAGALVVDSGTVSGLLGGAKSVLVKKIHSVGIATDISLCNNIPHSSVLCVEDADRNDPHFAQAKMALVKELAGPYKAIALVISDSRGAYNEVRAAAELGFPLLALSGPAEVLAKSVTSKVATFPSNGNLAELASFLHIHLTIDLFSM